MALHYFSVVDSLAVLARLVAPSRYRALVQVESLHNGLDWTTPSQKRDNTLIEFSFFLQAEKGSASGGTKSPLTLSATETAFESRMKFDIALTD